MYWLKINPVFLFFPMQLDSYKVRKVMELKASKKWPKMSFFGGGGGLTNILSGQGYFFLIE